MIEARTAPTELPTKSFLMEAREQEWPGGGSVEGVVDELAPAGRPTFAFVRPRVRRRRGARVLELWRSSGRSGLSGDWLPPLLHHLRCARGAERLLDEPRWRA